MSRTKYTRELLAPLVASSHSYAQVIRLLGLVPNGGYHRLISTRIRQLGIDTAHFISGRSKQIIEGISRVQLAATARDARSVAGVLAAFGLPLDGRAHRDMTVRLRELEIDTSHFQGSAWSRGETQETHPSLARSSRVRRLPDDQVFIENGPTIGGVALVRRLLAKGWPYRCAWCGTSTWREERLVLHLDHINGISNDHRMENLRLLCPNCHSQTSTYCNRRR